MFQGVFYMMLRISVVGLAITAAAVAATGSSPTFNKDVLPILQKNCQGCHRPGEVAPMSLLTYNDARPWAKAIKVAVVTKKMPPWFAEVGHFANDRRLSDADINTLVAWANNGAPEGDAKDAPPPLTFPEGWQIKPDMIIEMPKAFHVKATGTINYQNILVKANFPEDKWVVAAEMRAGNPKVVHHMRAIVRPPDSPWMAKAVPGEPYEDRIREMSGARKARICWANTIPAWERSASMWTARRSSCRRARTSFSTSTTPPSAREQDDQSKVGLVFAKTPPKSRYWMSPGTPAAFNLSIPPGDENAEVVSEVTVGVDDAELVYVQPHLHLRGKDYELRAIYPTGESQVVFKGKWNFDWQIGYQLEKPLLLPKGTRLVAIAHYDNSLNNKYNPDPTKKFIGAIRIGTRCSPVSWAWYLT